MTPGRVNLKIVADRLGLARRYQADLETMKAMGAEVTPEEIFHVLESGLGDLEAFAREFETAATRLAGGIEDREDLPLAVLC